jgi:hypothetical protein
LSGFQKLEQRAKKCIQHRSFAVRCVPPVNACFPKYHKKVRKICGSGEEEILTYDGNNSAKCYYSSAYLEAAVTWLRWENRDVCETRTEGFIQNDWDFMDIILLCWSNALTFLFEEAICRISRFHSILLPLWKRCPMWRCTYSGRQLTQEFILWGLKVVEHQYVTCFIPTSWRLEFWNGVKDFEKSFQPASLIFMLHVLIYLKTFLQMVLFGGTKKQHALDSWESIQGPLTANDTSPVNVCVLRLPRSAL